MTEEEREANRPRNVSICFESFSVDLADAAALQRAGLDDPKLYKELVDRVAKGKAIQEQFAVIRARSGEKAMLESISEQIYPTEYENGNVADSKATVNPAPANPPAAAAGAATQAPQPQSQPQAARDRDVPLAPPLGTSFETRNVGSTYEIEPTLGEDNQIIDLRAAPDLVTYAGRSKWSKDTSETEMPTFESQRTNTALTIRAGQPTLFGTPSRPPVSAIDPNSAKRVWFTFVTATVIKI